jgi:ribonuclease Z
MELIIIGCHSATPRENAHTTSQILEINGHLFLIDCGEGTQIQLRKAKINFSRINNIFISHLHGDHFYGLIGLISTFRLLGRDKPLKIHGPLGIKDLITSQLKASNSWTNYPLIFHELFSINSEVIFDDQKVFVKTLPLNHKVYTNGFFFKSKTSLPKTYAFCSDTAYNENLIELIKNVDLLYHESTFLNRDLELAIKTNHSTALHAATIALKSNVKKLILGHFSSRYKDKKDFLIEAKSVFKKSFLAEDLKRFFVK